MHAVAFQAKKKFTPPNTYHSFTALFFFAIYQVLAVNAVGPATLCARLKPLLLRSPHPRRFVVNVSAMEGQFARASKSHRHPHTNMAKAALNMLTRTSGKNRDLMC